MADALVPEPSVEIERTFVKLKRYKSPGTDQIPAEFIQSGGRTAYSMSINLSFGHFSSEGVCCWVDL
jgi:hypothetical protein